MHGEGVGITREQKEALDELHKRKIDIADEVLALNVNGYVGSSTRSEIEYAMLHGKMVRWLEDQADPISDHATGLSGEHDVVLDAIAAECLHAD